MLVNVKDEIAAGEKDLGLTSGTILRMVAEVGG